MELDRRQTTVQGCLTAAHSGCLPFIARKAEIDSALDRIRAANDDHFFASPEDVHWGHVTALADHAALLKRITDSIYLEAERAS